MLKLKVVCQKVGHSSGGVYTGSSLNVSPGGMLMKINGDGLTKGDLLNIEMSVPPTQGLLEYGGRFSSYARVLRIQETDTDDLEGKTSMSHQVALEFCQSPKLHV